MSLYTIVLHKIDMCCCKKQLKSWQKELGKIVVVEAGAYIVSIDRKTIIYRQEERIPPAHSNVFPYFADRPVSSSLYCRYSSRARLHNSV